MVTREFRNKKSGTKNLPDLQHALIAGEMLYGNDVANWREAVGDHVELVNLYGPSETTLAKLFYRIPQNNFNPLDVIPVGKPIPDTDIIIANENKPCTVGDQGEVFIKTTYMSNGYYNAPELNKNAFVINPLIEDPPSIVYKTGDEGFFMPDKNLQLTGRIDGQLKLNGKRIETGEIEIVLMRHPDIKNAAVKDWADAEGNRRLAGYIVTENQKPVTIEALRAFSLKQLPDYMVPNNFVYMESLPLTHNGKVDRKSLPSPSSVRPELEQNYEPPATITEKSLADIWSKQLCIDDVGVNDNFFDLGGNSVLSASVIAMINQKFQQDFDAVTLFQYPTIRAFADHLNNGKNVSFSLQEFRTRGNRRQASAGQNRHSNRSENRLKTGMRFY
jgi:non-ribosomal peptide synthetase component F